MTELTGVLGSIFDVFSALIGWITSAVTGLIPMFYVESTGLTFLGSLAVVGLGISVVFMVVGVIQNFLHFRG